MDAKRAAWREPMVWLVAGLPAASIVASIALVVVASSQGGSDSTADPVRRTAQIQVVDLGPDELAQRKRLSAIVRIERDLIEVLPVSGEFERQAPLHITLLHPAHAQSDREFVLRAGITGWRTAVGVDGSHDWQIRLSPGDGAWRLRGRLPKGQRAAHLRPAFGED